MKKRDSSSARRALQVVLAAGVAVGATQAVAATDLFLSISGLPGESQDSKHKNDIDVLSFSQTVDSSKCGQLVISKNVDRASPGLADAAARKSSFASATFTARYAGKDALEYYTLSLSSVTVSSVDQAFSGGGAAAAEQVVLSARTMTITYRPQNADGSLGAPVVAALDCRNSRKD